MINLKAKIKSILTDEEQNKCEAIKNELNTLIEEFMNKHKSFTRTIEKKCYAECPCWPKDDVNALGTDEILCMHNHEKYPCKFRELTDLLYDMNIEDEMTETETQ